MKPKSFVGLLLLVVMLTVSVPLTAQDEPYRDPALPVEERVEDLLARMTLDEKIGQMTLIEKGSLPVADVSTLFLGGALSGGGGYPTGNNTVEGWAAMVDGYQDAALSTRLGIPIIYGVDAVHGHNNMYGAVIFPHQIGLGATRNADLVRQTAEITAREMIATGIYWNYAPVLAPVRDIRWGRTYEGYAENTDVVTELGVAYIEGLQGAGLGTEYSVLASAKHYIGDGATTWGTSQFGPNNIDRGETQMTEDELRAILLPPYIAALDAGAMNVMASYSSWGGLPMHAQHYLLTEVLKGELGFNGFIVSDWAGIDVIGTYDQAVITSINAGVDMNMVPYDARRFIASVKKAVDSGDISIERIDDAVRRILRVKFMMGLFENPFSDPSLVETVGSAEHRAVARQAVSESLVLLKNDNAALPLAKDAANILVAGQGADNIGRQSGGWTIEWQGGSGKITIGTSILDAIREAVDEGVNVSYSSTARFDPITDADGNPVKADVGIFVFSEAPYAEYEGDDADLALSNGEIAAFERLKEASEKVVVILISGRPMIVSDVLNASDAFVAAWLPGTEGGGIADVLFGDMPFTGKLGYTWPRSIEQLPFDFNIPTEGCDAPLFPYDYGLTYDNAESEWLALAAECATVEEVEEEVPLVVAEGMIAPDGKAGETYYAPFPLTITLDGDLSDWVGVPRVTLATSAGDPGVSFAAAADADYLYLSGDITDSTIISGQHGSEYWNEDSVEFYLNGTGDLSLTNYQPGVFQINIPALNASRAPEDSITSGVNGPASEATIVAIPTDTGWTVEVAVPFKSGVWDIVPEHGGSLGFQVHLNGASSADRDTKLIWSIYDTSDQSYLNPSLFGELFFFTHQ